jgi:CRISPR system Cascade subunit CasD
MSVLLLRLAAPLQSWGVASRHNTRTTELVPSKSGVVGLLANALGRRRTDPIDDLAALRFGVRVDRPGELLVDYHTVSGASHAPTDPARQRLPTAHGGRLKVGASTKITYRHYLADAVFVAALEGDAGQVEAVGEAVRRPRRPLYLGRRSCPPTPPLLLAICHDADLCTALVEAEPQGNSEHTSGMPMVLDDAEGWDARPDHPVSFNPKERLYVARTVTRTAVAPVDGQAPHDPFALLTR